MGGGDADIAVVAALFADSTRARVLMALVDGRSLPASVLAAEAGVTPQATSAQLNRLVKGGLITGEKSGRHRYYRLASDHVAAIIEALAQAAPSRPIRSLREDSRAAALRRARACYDHLAGRLGCAITQALLEQEVLVATDGLCTTERRQGDRLSAQLPDHPYVLGPNAALVLARLGVPIGELNPTPSARPLLRFCLDWSEQRHHLGGRLGAEILISAERNGWIIRRPGDRAVTLTDRGRAELRSSLGLDEVAA